MILFILINLKVISVFCDSSILEETGKKLKKNFIDIFVIIFRLVNFKLHLLLGTTFFNLYENLGFL